MSGMPGGQFDETLGSSGQFDPSLNNLLQGQPSSQYLQMLGDPNDQQLQMQSMPGPAMQIGPDMDQSMLQGFHYEMAPHDNLEMHGMSMSPMIHDPVVVRRKPKSSRPTEMMDDEQILREVRKNTSI